MSHLEQIDPNFYWNGIQKICLKETFDWCKYLEEAEIDFSTAQLAIDVKKYFPSIKQNHSQLKLIWAVWMTYLFGYWKDITELLLPISNKDKLKWNNEEEKSEIIHKQLVQPSKEISMIFLNSINNSSATFLIECEKDVLMTEAMVQQQVSEVEVKKTSTTIFMKNLRNKMLAKKINK